MEHKKYLWRKKVKARLLVFIISTAVFTMFFYFHSQTKEVRTATAQHRTVKTAGKTAKLYYSIS